MALLSMSRNRSSTSTTSSTRENGLVSIGIPRNRSHTSLHSTYTHSSVSTHSTRSSYTTNSSASHHALPDVVIDDEEADRLASSPGTHLSPTTLAYLRPYAPNADNTPAGHSSARRSGMTSAATRSNALAKLVSPSTYSLSAGSPALSPYDEDNQGVSPSPPMTPPKTVPADMIVSTAGREVPVAMGFFDRALTKATLPNAASSASASKSATSAPRIPTHTGADPPSSPELTRSKSAQKKSSKSVLNLARKSSSSAISLGAKEEVDEEEVLLKQKAKVAARTGRGGLGNPSKMILARMKWMDDCEYNFGYLGFVLASCVSGE